MGLKILHSADWHLDSPFGGFDLKRQGLLRRELRQLPFLMADLCRREGCDLMLLSGDLLDGPVTRDCVDALKAALGGCGAHVFIAPGNHDYVHPDSPWLEQWPENVTIFLGEPESVALPRLQCRVWGGGYRAMDCRGMLEGFRAEGMERYRLGVFHGDALSSDSPYCPVTQAQVRSSGLNYLALGHTHKAGSFRAGQTLCAWPGCPMGRGWDETGEKGVWIVTLEDDVQQRFVSLPLTRFYEHTVEVGEDPLEDIRRVLPGSSGDYHRINLVGPGQADAEALRQTLKEYPNLWIRDFTEPPVDLWAGAGEDSLEGSFFALLRRAAEEASGQERRQIELAASLSRRLLEGREVKLP